MPYNSREGRNPVSQVSHRSAEPKTELETARQSALAKPSTSATMANAGWGFTIAWGLATVFTSLFVPDSAIQKQANLGTFWLTSMIGAPAGLLAFFFAKRSPGERTQLILEIYAIVVMTLGVALLEVARGGEGAHEILLAVAGLASSTGTAVLTVAWGSRYARLDMALIERMAALSLVLSFACYALALALPRTLAVALVLALPFLSVGCLRASRAASPEPAKRPPKTPGASDTAAPAPSAARSMSFQGFGRLGLGIVGTTTVVSLFWSLCTAGSIPLPLGMFSTSVLSGSAVAVALLAYLSRFARSLNLGTLYRWIVPIIAVAFSLTAFPSPAAIVGAALLVFAAQALLNLITFIYFAELSQRNALPATRVFGLGRFYVEIGFLLGTLVGPFAQKAIPFAGGYEGILLLAIALLICLVMASIATQDRLAFTLNARSEEGSAPDAATSREDAENPGSNHGSDSFQTACKQVTTHFGLTQREGEILPYLAQGYSLPYIRNELYISQSTIDTHVRHIYRKLNIHSKEELITLVRNTGRC